MNTSSEDQAGEECNRKARGWRRGMKIGKLREIIAGQANDTSAQLSNKPSHNQMLANQAAVDSPISRLTQQRATSRLRKNIFSNFFFADYETQAYINKSAMRGLGSILIISFILLNLTLLSRFTFASSSSSAETSEKLIHISQLQQANGNSQLANHGNEQLDKWEKHEPFSEQRERIVKKSSLAELSSADLPAEFREVDDIKEETESAPSGQSRLAKLCQQTSSVLASVLPAPFGGHKRSILCQFFGQVPLHSKARAPNSKSELPVGHFESQSVSVLQQPHQLPITLVNEGRHPIQMVLEQQQRQLRVPLANRQPPQLPPQDLRSSASVLDYAYQQRLEPPPSMRLPVKSNKKELKFSTPLMESSFKPLSSEQSPRAQTEGWRIFNQLEQSPSTGISSTPQPPASSKSATSGGKIMQTLTSSKTTDQIAVVSFSTLPKQVIEAPKNDSKSMISKRKELENINVTQSSNKFKQIVNQTTVKQLDIGKRSEIYKSTTPTVQTTTEDRVSSGIRTIEVVAQTNSSTSDSLPQKPTTIVKTTSTATQRITNEQPNQNNKREELVIASINNLTRIAFGNQLRDTVRVINKLIDQQSNLFNSSKLTDSMLTAESKQVSKSFKTDTKLISKEEIESNRTRQKQIQKETNVNVMKPTKKPKKQLVTTKLFASSTPPSSTVLRDFMTRKSNSSANTKSATASSARGSTPKMQTSVTRRLTGLHSVSRSLALDSTRKSTRSMEDMEPIPMMTITDIHRDKTPWRMSSTVKAPPVTRRLSTTSTTMRPTPAPSDQKQSILVSTRFPWLLPDKSVYQFQSDLFGGLTTVIGPKQSSSKTTSGWTTRKLDLSPMTTTGKQALVLNRLEKIENSKPDSLSTLKMSLTTPSVKLSTSSSPPSSTQSRWIPSTLLVQTTSTSSTPPITTTATTKATTTTSSVSPTAMAVSRQIDLGEDESITSLGGTLTQSDINEARATDSISKYTTHWNEANELLATTRRYFQQSIPQIAQTGEFFSAETISNWPERYQTMMGQALDGEKTTPAFQTTRRSGDSYELGTSNHRLDTSSANSAELPRTTIADLVAKKNLSNIAILPSNHKLTTSNEVGTEPTTPEMRYYKQSETRPTTNSIDSNTFELPSIGQEQIQPLREQTLLEEGSGKLSKFPHILGDYMVAQDNVAAITNNLGNNTSSSMKPPYIEPHENQQHVMYPLENQNSSKPYVSRKLYELLVPSTRNFVGSQNPLNQQRFNLSALKFLAQNLLSSSATQNVSPVYPVDSDSNSANNTTVEQQEQLSNVFDSQLPPNYYDLLLNESSGDTNKSSLAGKSLLGRAGNLLNDLKQLEHKKAAAILAAIRYQVPSPLVRPWDLASDSYMEDSLAQTNDRADHITVSRNDDSDSMRESILVARMKDFVKSALAKQQLIPRDELEARLSGSKILALPEDLETNRRSDDMYTIEGTDEMNYNNVKNATRLDEYTRDSLTSAIDETELGKVNKTRGWLNKLLQVGPLSLVVNQSVMTDEVEGRNHFQGDVETVEQYPKYIRIDEYKTASSAKPANLQTEKQRVLSSTIAAKLRDNMTNIRSISNSTNRDKYETKSVKDLRTMSDSGQQLDKDPNNFNCLDRQAGFYPDRLTSCQTFYHCSSTGHLLTFNCPQQTRFDESSLKCGPWFEVPCDLGRNKPRLSRF